MPNERTVSQAAARGVYNRIVKRLLDVLISVIALILLSPVLLIAALAVKLSSMVVGGEKTGSGVYSGKGDPRVTRVGRILRATSIDELPQLINILKGDMALIGPRPPLTYHPWPIGEYDAFQRHMFDVRPGITGWAQTHGRKDVEWHRRIELNVWYVEHVSFALDLKIFVFTNADNANKEETLKKDGADAGASGEKEK